MKNLVSILIPAYNAEKTLPETLRSALSQTWQAKEIIVVDDGSRDNTADEARRFASKNVLVVKTPNAGSAAARNHALSLCQGNYIQWLDADDLLAPDKIEKQLKALKEEDGPKTLLSGPWAPFYYRTNQAHFVENSLWHDLSPVDWLIRKMGENLHMQTGTWLTSRELTEAAGPWDPRMVVDDDGEYYCRVLLAAERTRFVRDAKVFYRVSPSTRVSHIGSSDKKKDAQWISMQLHIQYLRSLEDSERVRVACLKYLSTWYPAFYPERQDLMAEAQKLAAQLHGKLQEPRLRQRYAWIRPFVGWKAAKWAQTTLPLLKLSWLRRYDKIQYMLEGDKSEPGWSGERA